MVRFCRHVERKPLDRPLFVHGVEIGSNRSVRLKEFNIVEYSPRTVVRNRAVKTADAVRPPEKRIAETSPCRHVLARIKPAVSAVFARIRVHIISGDRKQHKVRARPYMDRRVGVIGICVRRKLLARQTRRHSVRETVHEPEYAVGHMHIVERSVMRHIHPVGAGRRIRRIEAAAALAHARRRMSAVRKTGGQCDGFGIRLEIVHEVAYRLFDEFLVGKAKCGTLLLALGSRPVRLQREPFRMRRHVSVDVVLVIMSPLVFAGAFFLSRRPLEIVHAVPTPKAAIAGSVAVKTALALCERDRIEANALDARPVPLP